MALRICKIPVNSRETGKPQGLNVNFFVLQRLGKPGWGLPFHAIRSADCLRSNHSAIIAAMRSPARPSP
jgi:hypothetical protein